MTQVARRATRVVGAWLLVFGGTYVLVQLGRRLLDLEPAD
jgi:hypothetical protein